MLVVPTVPDDMRIEVFAARFPKNALAIDSVFDSRTGLE